MKVRVLPAPFCLCGVNGNTIAFQAIILGSNPSRDIWACSSAELEHRSTEPGVGGSNPSRPVDVERNPMVDIRKCPLVWVKWIDSHTFSGWNDVQEIVNMALDANLVCESCGWLLKETDDRILLVCHRDIEFEKVDSIWVIPKLAILEWCDIVDN